MPASDALTSGVEFSLSAEVIARITTELPAQAKKIAAALQTAAALINLAVNDETGLRFPESAAYNVREALDAVVSGRDPAPGGLPAVADAWIRFDLERSQPGTDEAEALAVFEAVLLRETERRDRNSYHTAKLLGYLSSKSGVEPLTGQLDPIAEYKRLRDTAAGGLHSATALALATGLYRDTIAWFTRMFTPPDAIVLAIQELAAESWCGAEQIGRLRALASNPHHLRLFFAHVTDPAWLDPLHQAGAIGLPESGAPWPASALTDGLGRTNPDQVAAVMSQLYTEAGSVPPDRQLDARFNLMVVATHLGPAGYPIIADAARDHPTNGAVRALATDCGKGADATHPVVERVCDYLLNLDPDDHDDYYFRLLLAQLESGMTPENAEQRTKLAVYKLRRAAREPHAKWIVLGIARLTTELGDDDHDFFVVAAHYLARMFIRAHALGVPDQRLLELAETISGEVGERLISRVLAFAEDVPLRRKIDHVSLRLSSSTATGEDKDLVDAVLAAGPDPDDLAAWAEAMGVPSPQNAEEGLPRDWARAWRWATVLPAPVLERWREQIAAVSAVHGHIGSDAFDHRMPSSFTIWGQSPFSMDDLAGRPVLDAAHMIAEWRPDNKDVMRSHGSLELARTLESAVAADPQRWTEDPAAVVEALREPVYVLHYFTALGKVAKEITSRTDEIFGAAHLAKTAQSVPVALGEPNFDYEPDWRRVDDAIVDLITALARHHARLAGQLDLAWSWALEAVWSPPEFNDDASDNPLTRAMTNRRGRGLRAAVLLAAWEYHDHEAVRAAFVDTLDTVLTVTGTRGMEFRAILAAHRPLLEQIDGSWLDQRADALFRGDAGPDTMSLTLRYAQPTPWLYRNLRDEIVRAAQRGIKSAVRVLLVGLLRGEDGCALQTTISDLRKSPELLQQATSDVATLVQRSDSEAPELATAVAFWIALLDAERTAVPVEFLRHLGRWAFVTGVPEHDWAPLMLHTLQLTGGHIDYPIEVANRCESVPVPGDSVQILLLLLGHGEGWEAHHVAQTALNALRTLSDTRQDEGFADLRTRLIELGYHDAIHVSPYEG
ncbi:hypothetical protein ACWEVP_37400 [Amycolatopsis sp. NPDC003865]